MWIVLLWCLFLLCCLALTSQQQQQTNPFLNPSPSSFDVQQLAEGEKQYQLLRSNANLPQYGRCWTAAIQQIDTTCTALNEKSQAMLALQFTKCFMEMSSSGGDGRRDADAVRQQQTDNLNACNDIDCISNMSERAFQAYTHFYTHTQNICFYLMHQIWHSETESTINQLRQHSHSVSKQLELAGRLQINLLTQQRDSLKLQQKLVAHGVNLSDVLTASRSSLSLLTEQFRNSTIEQGRQLGDLFQRLSQFHNWIVGEYTFVEQIMYFTMVMIAIWIATTAKRTENCRFPLFLLVAANLAIESLIQRYVSGADYFIEDLKIVLFDTLWLIRKVFLMIMIGVYVWMTMIYVDSQKLTMNLLERIHRQNVEVLRILNDMKVKGIDECDDNGSSGNYGNNRYDQVMRVSAANSRATSTMGSVNAVRQSVERDDEYFRRTRMGTPVLRSSVIREFSVDKVNNLNNSLGVTTRLRSRQATPSF